MPAAEHETENKLSTQHLTLLNPLLAVGDLLIPREINPWGAANATAAASRLGKPAGGRKSAATGRKSVAAADRRKEEGELPLRGGWLGTSSAAVIYYLHYRRSWKPWRTSGSP